MENNKNIINQNKRQEIEEKGNMGIPLHSQVIKIKKEIEKIKHPSLQQPEMRRLLLREINRQRSRSPLGFPQTRISVGN